MAFDSRYEADAAKPPISLHPAFPAIVALWFAALLGVGSLVLPAVLLDRAVVATGLASFVPAASPPLGFTARGLIAIAAAIVGAGLGVAIARRVAQAHRPQPESRIAKLAGYPRRPLSIKDELGGANGLGGVTNGESLPISRRRALAISEDDRPSDFLYQAPLPGEDENSPAPFAAAPFVETAPETVGAADEPLELCELAAEDLEPVADSAAQPEDEPDEDFEMIDSREFQSAWPSHQHYPPAPDSEPADELDAELDKRKNLAGPRGLEPLPFSAPSLARRAPEPEPEPELEPEPEVQLEAVATADAPAADEPEFRADWESAPLEGLGLVQLVQRLGSTIERRRERMAQGAQVPAPQFVAPAVDFEAAPAEEAALAMAAFFAPNSSTEEAAPMPEPDQAQADEPREAAPVEDEDEPTAMPRPGFLQPFATEDEDEDEATVPDFTLPLRRPAAATVSFSLADNDGEEEEDDAAEESEESNDGYSSLLGMSNPFAAPKAEFVRIEEPDEHAELVEPTVVFPGQEEPARPAEPAPAFASRLFDPPGKADAPAPSAGQAPGDTDAALRAALATLQRMSGAA